ncbi:hypothetical protein Tco_1009615 [Tanacetum coccineum]
MMYERPPTTPFQKPPRNTTFPFQRYTLVFQQHQDEPIYDAWTRFKNLIKRVPHHGLDLWSLTQFFYDHVDDFTRMNLDFEADGNLRELSEIANLKAQAKRLFGNEDVWVEIHRGIAWDKVENSDPQSTPQVFSSFEEYTPLVTCPKEVEETLGTPVEVEPLDETQLEDLGLNTYNHDIPLSNREVPSFDKPEPQLNPLPNCLSLDISLGEERGPEPPIKPQSPDSFRMKEVDSLTINTPPSPLVASSHPKDTCFDDDWGLESKEVSPLGKELSLFDESKEVSPLGEELSLFDRPNEVERGRILEAHRLESILQQKISQRMAPSHHNVVFVFDNMLYLMRRNLEVLRKFHWMILGGQFNQLSHVLLENIGDNVQLKCTDISNTFSFLELRVAVTCVLFLSLRMCTCGLCRLFWRLVSVLNYMSVPVEY